MDLLRLMASMMRPGMEPMYVLRWPRMSASSRTPPRLSRASLRLRALATLMAMEVLPTPGGPTRQRICPRPSGFICRTAMVSRMRRFTFSRPKWSLSKIFLAASTFSRSRVRVFHGISRHTSRYPRITALSALV